ncbi:MAG: 30S ribosomal protein S24e [archaeon]|nr:30S ribosomal protein S24e [archaeon]
MMRVQIENRNENPLLNREEVNFTVKETQITPSRQELRKQVAAQTNADEKLLVVDVFNTSYGTAEMKGVARIYKNEAQMKKTELKYILVRNFGKEEEKKVVKKKEEAPAVVAEEKKE